MFHKSFKDNDKPNHIRGWYLPEHICDGLISFFENNSDKHHIGKYGDGAVNKLHKDSTDFSFDIDIAMIQNSFVSEYSFWLNSFLELYKSEFRALDKYLDIWGIVEKVNIQRYNPSQGFHSVHCESIGENTSQRILVFQTYLNTVINGGETEFEQHQYKTPAEKGLTVLFPAGWTHPHRGCVSNTETKYIITGWYSYLSAQNKESVKISNGLAI